MRSISKITEAALKANTQAAYDAVGGVTSAAKIIGVGSPILTKYASPDPQWASSFIRVDLALDLDRRSAHPFILTTLAREAGYALVKDEGSSAEVSLCPMGLLRLDGVLDDVVRELASALSDGHLTAAEKKAGLKVVGLAKQHLAKVAEMLIGGDE
ncbi:hypothetical protein [Agrobacterium fabrum]|uniref:hypothetical protein n=1 Tax=Agrobacterium fabrum TaxID=1176649 RepID=UPI003BA2828A